MGPSSSRERSSCAGSYRWWTWQNGDSNRSLTWSCVHIRVVLQRVWKEPATGEKRWQVVVPEGLCEGVLRAMHRAAGSGHPSPPLSEFLLGPV